MDYPRSQEVATKSRLLALLVVALLSVLDAGASRLHADVFIKQKQHTDASEVEALVTGAAYREELAK